MFELYDVDAAASRQVPTMLAISPDPTGDHVADQAAALSRTRIIDRVRYAQAGERLASQVALDIVLLEASQAQPDMLDALLDAVTLLATETDARVVVAFATEQLDQVAAQTTGGRFHLLCEPTMIERVAAIALAGRPDAAFHDSIREREDDRLRRLNDEVARIADTLARLTRGGGAARQNEVTMRDRSAAFMPSPVPSPPALRTPEAIDPADIRGALRARRMRAQFFDVDLFADPAWDMLLDLFAARLEHTVVSVSSLCIAAAVPPTTALRWIATMTEAGLLERRGDPLDRRRAYIALSAPAVEGMRRYVAAVQAAGLGIA